ncbi:MAG: acetate--CoA ligase family protein, partial [Chloroflexota bacterium]|nr:acetate--CoA ligase family protein [Chloroflexota bacterium]
HDSGGERGMVVDLAADLNLPFADLVPETMAVLEQTLDPGLEPGNPADLWGSGHDWQRIYRTCIGAMLQDPAVGAFNFGIDFNIGSRLGPDYRAIAIDAFKGTDKPFAVTTNVSAGMDPAEAGDLRAAGVPVLLGTETGLRAFGHLIRHAERARFDRSMPKPVPGLAEALHENRSLDDREVIGEFESLAILRSAGLPAIEAVRITSPADLQPAAKAVGFPLVLKTAVEGILHKSDVDGVVTGIATPDSLEEAYSSLAQRLGPDAVVQPQADLTRGLEFFLGATRDPQFGPLVTVGLGGVLIEIMRDAVSFLAPVGPAEVRYRLPELRGAALFRGARGRAPVDLDALARLVSRFSHFVAAIGDEFAEIDANPVLACGEEFLVLDALIVLARAE